MRCKPQRLLLLITMMLENADQTIQHAQKQESMAYQAKKSAFHELQKSIDRRYGDDLLDHSKIRNYAIEVSPSYESSSISLNIYIRLAEKYEKILEKINDSEDLGEYSYRVSWTYKYTIKRDLEKQFIDEWGLETDIYLRVVPKERFERLRK